MDVNKSVSTLMAPTCVPVEVATDFYIMDAAVQVNNDSEVPKQERLSMSYYTLSSKLLKK